MKRIPIWIDTDPGVDDAAAILVAHRSPALQIVGISTLAGNAPLGVTTHNALALCAFLGADYPVYCGAAQPWRPYLCGADFHGADGMGGYRLPEPTREAGKSCRCGTRFAPPPRLPEEPLTVVTPLPLTNLATAFAKYPDLPQKLDRVVMMGGAAVGGNRTPCAEYNIFADPDAALAVFRSRGAARHVRPRRHERRMAHRRRAGGRRPAGDSAVCSARAAAASCKKEPRDRASWLVHPRHRAGVVSAAPGWFSEHEAGVYVETRSELTRGKTVTDLFSDKNSPRKRDRRALNRPGTLRGCHARNLRRVSASVQVLLLDWF